MNYNKNLVAYFRQQYPAGTRIRLGSMQDPYTPVPPGTMGTVDHVDDACSIHMRWDNGQGLALIPGEDSFSVVEPPLQTLKLYMPLTVITYEENEWGDWADEPTELDDATVLRCKDNILAAILKERLPDETDRGMMAYYHGSDSVDQKVQSYVFTVEEMDGRLMGVAVCRVRGELTPDELEKLKDTISGQASDGFGEGFEQREIKTAEGELYVSLWSSDKSWCISTESELMQGQGMGGMRP